MSATVLSFPERHYLPNLPKLFKLIDEVEGDPDGLFASAVASLAFVSTLRESGRSPRECQQIVDGLTLCALALMTMLGVPREEMENALPPAE